MKGYTIQHSIELLEEEVKNGGGSGGSTTAANVSYDNTDSGLTAETVQAAIDEIVTDIPEVDPIKEAIVLPFIDTTNVLQAKVTAGVETLTYTPTVDCAIVYVFQANNTKPYIEIDGVEVACIWSTGQITQEGILYLKAGQIMSLVSPTAGSCYTVYGLVPAFTPNNTRKRKK